MQNDILSPQSGRSSTRKPMPGLRLRGHSLDNARERLSGGRSQAAINNEAPIVLGEDSGRAGTVLDSKPAGLPPRKTGRWQSWSRRRKVIVVGLVLLLLTTIGTAMVVFLRKDTASAPTTQVKGAPPKLTTVPSPLSGVQVAPELAKRPVTAIMIENSTDARPQSGLNDAGIVFEAIAEGGITRFITLYQDTSPQYVGPVRSLRPYYIDWATPFDAGIAHVGGSPEALAQIRSSGKDLDQFFNAGSYWRVSSRSAPHNVYTSFEKMDALNKKKGYNNSKFTSWSRKTDKALAVPTARTIDVNISSVNFNSHYVYDAPSNSYLRSEGGKPHIITNSATDTAGQQLHPKTVLALVMGYSIDGTGHSNYTATGSGQLFVFQDGSVTTGTWSKADRKSQFVFADSAGAPIKLNAGQAWVTAVANPGMVVYHP